MHGNSQEIVLGPEQQPKTITEKKWIEEEEEK